jgi:hypothetical protein
MLNMTEAKSLKNPLNMLEEAARLIGDRGEQYGPPDRCFDAISKIATVMLDRPVSARDVAMVLLATKLARMVNSPKLADSYVDAINYLAFAARFAEVDSSTQGASIEDDIAAVAKRFAPVNVEKLNEEDTSLGDRRSGGHTGKSSGKGS